MQINPKSEWTLGLVNSRENKAPHDLCKRFYYRSIEILSRIGSPPTHLIVDGHGHSGKWTRFPGKSSNRIIDSDFTKISSLGLCHTPGKSNAPGYDRVSKIIILDQPEIDQISINLTVRELIVNFQGVIFHELLLDMLDFDDWKFGWALSDINDFADYHIIGITHNSTGPEEQSALNRWYNSESDERFSKPRDIFPVNIFHTNHLILPVGGRTLGEFIHEVPGTRVEVMAGHTVWTMPPEMVDGLREELGAAGILIARG